MTKSRFSEAYASLLQTLIELRRRQGVSQAELARRLGRLQPFVSYLERGERRIDVVEFYAICTALDVDPQEAFASVIATFPAAMSI